MPYIQATIPRLLHNNCHNKFSTVSNFLDILVIASKFPGAALSFKNNCFGGLRGHEGLLVDLHCA